MQDYDELLKFDELMLSRKESQILKEFTEGSLTFDPTYKYNFNSNDYDTSSKNRVPSWCDRILYEEDSNLTQVYYGRTELKLSDHRPVFGLFEAKIRKINDLSKQEIEDKLIEKFKSLNPMSSPTPKKIASPEKNTKKKLMLGGSVIEPSIGDFGLVENIDTSVVHQTPRASASKSLVTLEDPDQLDELIKK